MPPIRCASALSANLLGTGTTGAVGSSSEIHAGVDLETNLEIIDLDRFCLYQKVIIYQVLKAVYIKHTVVFFQLIQSHSKGWAASTAFIQKDPYRRNLLAFEIFSYLFRC